MESCKVYFYASQVSLCGKLSRIFIYCVAVSVIFFCIPPSKAQEIIITPPRQVKDQSLRKFISKMRNHVVKQDFQGLIRCTDRQIINGFSVPEGRNAFISKWENNQTLLWQLLEHLLDMGPGRINPNSWEFPYVYRHWPGELDAKKHGLITGNRVNIREGPGLFTEKIGQLSHVVVKVDLDQSSVFLQSDRLKENKIEKHNWYSISTLDNRMKGYVYWKYLWRPGSWRMTVEKMNGRWWITALISDDG